MRSKWLIKGLEGKYVVGEDKEIYRLPFSSNHKFYEVRQVKKQYGNRYWLDKNWYSIKLLKRLTYRDPSPIIIFEESTCDCPF
jgi:hypothetical protein